jgi:peptide subunit release factor RF-3
MAQTVIFKKADFLEFIAKQIKDDECVIMTDTLQSVESNKKRFKAVFNYAPDIFPTLDVRNMMHAKNVAACIAKISNMTEEDIKTLTE